MAQRRQTLRQGHFSGGENSPPRSNDATSSLVILLRPRKSSSRLESWSRFSIVCTGAREFSDSGSQNRAHPDAIGAQLEQPQ